MVYGLSMEKFQIEPMTAPPGSDEYLPCDEQHATRWVVRTLADSGVWLTAGWFDNRAMAEAHAAGKLQDHVQKLNDDRAARFIWRDGDVEHH
jgi:hypothetical protein